MIVIYLDLVDVVVEVMDSNNTRACIYIYIFMKFVDIYKNGKNVWR